ncbi:hypothetical protein EBZ80_06440 [bacterium]|nr:hypothetical protein [bacterium]
MVRHMLMKTRPEKRVYLAILSAVAASCMAISVPAAARPRVEVAFLEVRDVHGQSLRLEPWFPWAHMAISHNGGWIHSHPATGVEWASTERLAQFGRIAHVVSVPDWIEPRMELAAAFTGLPYDRQFSWDNQALYCSELVAKLLGIAPVPMVFDPRLWPGDYLRFNGQPGISPGIVYRRIVEETIAN